MDNSIRQINTWRSLRYAGYIYQTIFPHVILETIYAPDEVWGRDYGKIRWSILQLVDLSGRHIKVVNFILIIAEVHRILDIEDYGTQMWQSQVEIEHYSVTYFEAL